MSVFSGFSEDDIKKLKTEYNSTCNDITLNLRHVKMSSKLQSTSQYKHKISDENTESIEISLEKCNPDIKDPSKDFDYSKKNTAQNTNNCNEKISLSVDNKTNCTEECRNKSINQESSHEGAVNKKLSKSDAEAAEKNPEKLDGLRLRQRLIEEQNKKRKEMLSKALADRTKQTEEEALRLEKIKNELAFVDGQFSQDVAVLRKKIDLASLVYAEAEKNYLRVEKEFLQAKHNLQKEKEKKELLSEHLCALIMHSETQKAQKLVILMDLLSNVSENTNTENVPRNSVDENGSSIGKNTDEHRKSKYGDKNNKTVRKDTTSRKNCGAADKNGNNLDDTIEPIVVDGVDERTGKMVEEADLN